MKTRPLTLTQTEARAAHEGRLSCVVRVVRLPHDAKWVNYWAPPSGRTQEGWADPGVNYWTKTGNHIDPCPLGTVGDELWGREAFAFPESLRLLSPAKFCKEASDNLRNESLIWYRANGECPNTGRTVGEIMNGRGKWRPSTTMPRWASRTTLRLESVAVKRVQDLTEEEAMETGVEKVQYAPNEIGKMSGAGEWFWTGYENKNRAYRDTALESFASLFNAQHGPGSFESNCWVWVATVSKV